LTGSELSERRRRPHDTSVIGVTSGISEVDKQTANADKQEQAEKTSSNSAKRGESAQQRLPSIHQLHSLIGNRATGLRLQAKLAISLPGDAYEQEADRVADQVMRMPDRTSPITVGVLPQISRLQRKCGECEEEEIRRQPMMEEGKKGEEEETLQAKEVPGQAPEVTPDVQTRISALRGGGQPLPTSVRAFFEPRFGHDFSQVRVHTDAQAATTARAVNAQAYTIGRDMVFGAGHYAPETESGRRLLAHELTHIVQQQGDGTPSAAHTNSLGTGGVMQRAISPELDQIESYLSYGIFDWAITDEEAIKALEMLKALPKYQQAVFFSNEKYAGRLRDNLPGGRIGELDALEASVAGITPPRSEVEDIESKLSYGIFDWAITDKEAIEALEKLKKLPDPQLAVALGAINYDRLIDNLPDARKQELIDLVARVSAETGGLGATGAAPQPGSMLNAITFKSDHGLMQNNVTDWGRSGKVFGEPEWFIKDGAEVSHPISQTKGTRVEAELNLNVLPATPAAESITIEGKSDVGLLDFYYTGTILGGLNRRVSLTSTRSLPDTIAAFNDEHIVWTIQWHGSTHRIAPAAGHTVFVTMDKPRRPEEVTFKRMAKAIEIIGDLGTLDPHEIVTGIMSNWNVYDLAVPMRGNIWTFADEIAIGGQCIDIVRFVMALIEMVGCPGEAAPVVVWAHPNSADKAIEQIFEGPVGLHTVGPHKDHGDWGVGLLDAGWKSNAYEAALKFSHSGRLAYYPGGVDAIFSNKQEVLEIFRCLAWLKSTGGLNCRIMEVAADYPPGPCPVGSEHVCYVP
jgi:hypothetical protein